jgi:hypothetical protein
MRKSLFYSLTTAGLTLAMSGALTNGQWPSEIYAQAAVALPEHNKLISTYKKYDALGRLEKKWDAKVPTVIPTTPMAILKLLRSTNLGQ